MRALTTSGTPAASAADRECPDVVGVLGGRAQTLLAVDGVLDVDAHGAGVEDPFDEVGRGGVVAGLHVGAHRHVDRGGDAADPVQGVVEGHCLVGLAHASLRGGGCRSSTRGILQRRPLWPTMRPTPSGAPGWCPMM